jgi:hypothetical protein
VVAIFAGQTIDVAFADAHDAGHRRAAPVVARAQGTEIGLFDVLQGGFVVVCPWGVLSGIVL